MGKPVPPEDLPAHERRVTLADVSRLARVSKSTASRALSGQGSVAAKTRDNVRAAAVELGFVASNAASSLATGRSRNFGLITPFLNRWFYGEVIAGVESSLTRAGYDLTLYRVSDDPEQRRNLLDYFLVRKGVDAVIALSLDLSPEEVRMLRSIGKPIIGIGGKISGIPTFSIDDVKISRRATEHLIELGHTRIIHIGGNQEKQLDFQVHTNRLKGFREALNNANLGQSEDFFADDFDIAGGYRSARRALIHPQNRPTAIFAGSDEIAIGAITAARELGIRIPKDLSIIGIDGHPARETFGLTTINQHPSRQGNLAVLEALNLIGGTWTHARGSHFELQVDFEVRTSTAPPPA